MNNKIYTDIKNPDIGWLFIKLYVGVWSTKLSAKNPYKVEGAKILAKHTYTLIYYKGAYLAGCRLFRTRKKAIKHWERVLKTSNEPARLERAEIFLEVIKNHKEPFIDKLRRYVA